MQLNILQSNQPENKIACFAGTDIHKANTLTREINNIHCSHRICRITFHTLYCKRRANMNLNACVYVIYFYQRWQRLAGIFHAYMKRSLFYNLAVNSVGTAGMIHCCVYSLFAPKSAKFSRRARLLRKLPSFPAKLLKIVLFILVLLNALASLSN